MSVSNQIQRLRQEIKVEYLPSKFEVLASLEGKLHLVLAGSALETENNLLSSLGLLVEDRLSLSSVTYFNHHQINF